MMSAVVPVAQSGINALERTANVPVIGWSKRKIRHSKKGVTTEVTESIQVRAWELGVVALGLAVYEYVKGGQSPGSTSQGSTLPGWLQSLENFNQGGTLIKW